jgi:hypothetical protein
MAQASEELILALNAQRTLGATDAATACLDDNEALLTKKILREVDLNVVVLS